jgi:hypothetical protein
LNIESLDILIPAPDKVPKEVEAAINTAPNQPSPDVGYRLFGDIGLLLLGESNNEEKVR